MDNQPQFAIGGGNASFADKQKKLFDLLSQAEKCVNFQNNDQMECDYRGPAGLYPKKKKSEMKQFRGRESIFKRPEAPISKCLRPRNVPDYCRNPEKWMKYSLADVTDTDMSERSNTNAALSFLQEIEQRRDSIMEQKSGEDLPDKIIFNSRRASEEINQPPQYNKSIILECAQQLTAVSEDKPMFRNSKVIMPEYVIGQKVKKDKKGKPQTTGQVSVGKELKLDHLLEDEDDDLLNCILNAHT